MVRNEFREGENTTVGVEFGEKKLGIEDKIVKTQIWDTAGQAKFRAVSSVYYRGAASAFLIYDITSRKSFESLEFWHKDIREHANSDVIILIIGNKYDLRAQREVSHEEAEAFAHKLNLPHMYTSAFDGYNIELAFNVLIKESYNSYKTALSKSIASPDEGKRRNSKTPTSQENSKKLSSFS